MKTQKLYRKISPYFNLIVLMLAITLAGCSPIHPADAGSVVASNIHAASVAQPLITSGEVEAIRVGATKQLFLSTDAVMLLQDKTGNLVVARPLYQEVTEFSATNVVSLRDVGKDVTGQLCRTTDWKGIEQMLIDLEYRTVTWVELAAAYTGQLAAHVARLSSLTLPTFIVIPSNVDASFWTLYPEYQQ